MLEWCYDKNCKVGSWAVSFSYEHWSHPCQKKPRKARKPRKSLETLAFLAFPCFFGRWKAWKSQESMEIPGFLGKTGMFFQEKPGKPGEGSGLSRKAWILSIQTKPKKSQERQEWLCQVWKFLAFMEKQDMLTPGKPRNPEQKILHWLLQFK